MYVQILRGETIHHIRIIRFGVASPARGQFEFLSYEDEIELTEAEERTITREIRRLNPDEFVVSALTVESLQNDTEDQREDRQARR